MAKTNTERQRDWRRRQAECQSAVARLTDEMATWKAETRRWGEACKAEIAGLRDELEAARKQAAGQQVPPCRVCGGELACPRCYLRWRAVDV